MLLQFEIPLGVAERIELEFVNIQQPPMADRLFSRSKRLAV
jgi:hypothetical protein